MKKLLLIASSVFLFFQADAKIVRIEITSVESPAFGGRKFGNVGAYEKLRGKAYGELNPFDPQNAKITDIQLAPRNKRGMVEYSTDFYILKPINLARGNRKLFEEIPNRGGKTFGSFNKSSGGNDPSTAEEAGDAFLMNQGYILAWCGWDISATSENNKLTITVPVAKNPDGSAITGPSYEYIESDNDRLQSYKLAYAAALPDKAHAKLTYKAFLNDAPQIISADDWEYMNDRTIRLLPAGTPFKQSGIYEFYYDAKDPLVAGIGLASTRDFVSFLRNNGFDDKGHRNPLFGAIDYTYSYTESQPARYINDFQTLGFNIDEMGRRVIDGILNWLGGGSGVGINYRFAQPGRTERNRQNHFYPEAIFPFAYPALTDPNSGLTKGRSGGYPASLLMPKVMEVNSANEYWAKAASLLHSDLQGNDLPDPVNVRFYLLSGMQHGSGHGKGVTQQLQNPTRPDAVLRALFVDLDEWVSKNIAPPESRVPRRYNGTAALATAKQGSLTGFVPQKELGWPDIPGVTYTGLITTRYCFNYGPQIRQGIISQYPDLSMTYPSYTNFVSKVDADGNEIAGIHLPPVAAPTGTYTGWALRAAPFAENDGGESAGQYIPFKITKAERIAAGDPRPSLQERYNDHNGYVEAVTKAVQNLVKNRLLLHEDAANYIREAAQNDVLK